jgi:hypothetical protein
VGCLDKVLSSEIVWPATGRRLLTFP